jgi:hypothetical protein
MIFGYVDPVSSTCLGPSNRDFYPTLRAIGTKAPLTTRCYISYRRQGPMLLYLLLREWIGGGWGFCVKEDK